MNISRCGKVKQVEGSPPCGRPLAERGDSHLPAALIASVRRAAHCAARRALKANSGLPLPWDDLLKWHPRHPHT